MKILSIETSCDETAIALLEASGGLSRPKFKILENLVASQIDIHKPFGGVVPNLAKREHIKKMPILLNQMIGKKSPDDFFAEIDLMVVTVGPGLEPALWTGVTFAKELAKAWKKPLTGANHLEGHLYSPLLEGGKLEFPAAALIVSGGHTILLRMKDISNWKKIGETRDDAVGECYDKVARLLELPYPGGPEIEKLAKEGDPKAISFPRPMIYQKNYDFSFSGLKTAVLYYLRDNKTARKADVAASFQEAAIDVLIAKTLKAAKEIGAKSLIIGGGVAANKTLQKSFATAVKKEKLALKLFIPSLKFCTDNAAIIAAAAYVDYLKGKKRKLSARGNLSL